jgi:hypothetical protein
MDLVLPVILTVIILFAIFALLALGWRNRLKRQAGIDPLPQVPAGRGAPLLAVPGQYVATTTAGDWLDRVSVHQLGLRTNAVMEVDSDGVLISRNGAADLWIAAGALSEVRTESGMAGKFVERDGLVVLSWKLGATAVDTGFRTREAAAKKPLLAALAALAEPADRTEQSDQAGRTDQSDPAGRTDPAAPAGPAEPSTEQTPHGKNS